MTRALVTGSNGFIGSTLVERLIQDGIQVTCLVRRTSDLRWLEGLTLEYCTADLRKPEILQGVIEKADFVYHLAGTTKAKNRAGYLAGNYEITVQLLMLCDRFGPSHQKFIFASSQAAAGPGRHGEPVTEADEPHPISIYGQTKLMAEQAVLDYASSHAATIVRPPSVYGPRDKDILAYFQNVNKGVLPVLGDGRQKISLVHVDDLIRGLRLAAESREANGKVFFICDDGEYDWLTIGKLLSRILNKKTITLHIPYRLLDLVSFLQIGWFRLQGKPALLNRDKVREMKQSSWLCSNRRAKQVLGFRPRIDLEEGLRDTAEWYKSENWIS
ncbi:NAD-dependent epimerase/dehydratase family protein [candidate division KSB1 bacterium]|nr:NAD-dependent epimerase/dehydratase family protein [candidate division KSB1 bacterium]